MKDWKKELKLRWWHAIVIVPLVLAVGAIMVFWPDGRRIIWIHMAVRIAVFVSNLALWVAVVAAMPVLLGKGLRSIINELPYWTKTYQHASSFWHVVYVVIGGLLVGTLGAPIYVWAAHVSPWSVPVMEFWRDWWFYYDTPIILPTLETPPMRLAFWWLILFIVGYIKRH